MLRAVRLVFSGEFGYCFVGLFLCGFFGVVDLPLGGLHGMFAILDFGFCMRVINLVERV